MMNQILPLDGYSHLILLYLTFSLAPLIQTQGDNIILQSPEDITVFANETALFKCQIDTGFIGWIVNGTEVHNLPMALRNEINTSKMAASNSVFGNLTIIKAREEYDGITVQCFGIDIDINISQTSKVAILTIQGLLSSVVDLKATSNFTSVVVNWTAPFSLDVTNGPDIMYSLLIYDVTDENNPQSIPCADCTTHYTYYEYTPAMHGSPCRVYNFTVIPINGAGYGESSHNVTGRMFNTPSYKAKAISTRIARITFDNQVNDKTGCSNDYTITPAVEDGMCINSIEPAKIFDLCRDRGYQFLFSSPYLENDSNFLVSTYDVQSVSVQKNKLKTIEKIVYLRMEFIDNSNSLGCFLVLQPSETDVPAEFWAWLRPANELTLILSLENITFSSVYTVFVYDLEEDGLPNENPAQKLQNVTVTVSGKGVTENSSFSIEYVNNSAIKIMSEVQSDMEELTLAYQHCDTKTLLVKPLEPPFPIIIQIDDPLNYTFALLDKTTLTTGGRSIESIKFPADQMTPSDTQPTTIPSKNHDEIWIPIVVTLSILFSVAATVVICVVIFLIWRNEKNK